MSEDDAEEGCGCSCYDNPIHSFLVKEDLDTRSREPSDDDDDEYDEKENYKSYTESWEL